MDLSAGRVDASSHLSQRLIAEGIGTGFLVVAVIGSGIMATRLTTDTAIQLLANAAATAGALIALIWTVQSLSGAHLNPVVTLVDRLCRNDHDRRGARLHRWPRSSADASGRWSPTSCSNSPSSNAPPRFDRPVRCGSARSSPRSGLLLVINGCVRSGRGDVVAIAVGVWIGGAYWFTSSTSFANPAVTVARTLSDSFAGIAPSSVPMFIAHATRRHLDRLSSSSDSSTPSQQSRPRRAQRSNTA